MAVDFKEPWCSISEYPEQSDLAFAREAKTEIPSDHPLAGKDLVTLARREDCDDVLFEVDGGPVVAVVHLTWSGKRERSGFPSAEQFANLAEFVESRMEADHLEFTL